MTREMKYGVIGLIGLLILVPTVSLIIKASAMGLGLIFNYPGYVLTALVGMAVGAKLNQLSK